MAVTTLSLHPTSFNVASSGSTYAIARAGTGDVYVNPDFSWIGQFAGPPQESNQVMVGFDTSAIPGTITSAKLKFTVAEGYGTTVVEARVHPWTDYTSFVPGASLASKTLVGSQSVVAGFGFNTEITLTGVTASSNFKMVLSTSDQRTGTTGDRIIRAETVTLEVTYTPLTTVLLTTVGNGNWTVPAGVTEVYAETWGAGGGGATQGGVSAGGGAYSAGLVSVTPGVTRNYFIGAGGEGSTGNQSGGIGGDTWFGSNTTIMAKGGFRCRSYDGSSPAQFATIAIGGGLASGGFGTVKYSGGNGWHNGGGGGSATKNGNGQAAYNGAPGSAPSAFQIQRLVIGKRLEAEGIDQGCDNSFEDQSVIEKGAGHTSIERFNTLSSWKASISWIEDVRWRQEFKPFFRNAGQSRGVLFVPQADDPTTFQEESVFGRFESVAKGKYNNHNNWTVEFVITELAP